MTENLGDFSMFELFKAEAETHCAALNDGLVAIESNPEDLSRIEPMMRAAHSIKGAARIIGLDIAVGLAHAMEDCFVAVQKGQQQLTSGRVDQLLQGVDCLARIAALTEDAVADWSAANTRAVETLINDLRAAAPADAPRAAEGPPPAPTPPAVPPDTTAAAEVAPSPAAAAPSEPPAEAVEEATLRVNARNLNRMMQLASESMISARHFQAVHRGLMQLRSGMDWIDFQTRHPATATEFQQRLAELEQVAWRSERLSSALYHEVLGSRMRPFADGVTAFPRMVRDLARGLGKKAALKIEGADVAVDRDILRKLEAPLNHILRNSVDHGIESLDERRAAGKPERGSILLTARHQAGMLTVQVRDDGKGIDAEAIRRKVIERKLADESLAAGLTDAELMEFLFLPGFSTAKHVTEVSGRGVGLDVVRSIVQEVAGTIRVDSQAGRSTTFTFRLPVTLSVIRAALAMVNGEPYAFPLTRLVRVARVPADRIKPVEGRQQFVLDGESVGLVSAVELFALGSAPPLEDIVSAIVIGQPGQLCGLAVDSFVGEQDLVVRPLDARLGNVPHIAATAMLETGEPLLIVDVEDLFQSVQQLLGEGRLRGVVSAPASSAAAARRRVLVVDDSITVREVERQLLRKNGYDVDVAVDGRDGWNALRAAKYDLLITDVDMPRMNGIELIRTVRREQRFAELPIIIVSYKDREDDRMLGMDAGANAYLTKGSFHDDSLIATVADLIGGSH